MAHRTQTTNATAAAHRNVPPIGKPRSESGTPPTTVFGTDDAPGARADNQANEILDRSLREVKAPSGSARRITQAQTAQTATFRTSVENRPSRLGDVENNPHYYTPQLTRAAANLHRTTPQLTRAAANFHRTTPQLTGVAANLRLTTPQLTRATTNLHWTTPQLTGAI